jgi:23S rRNA (uracil1939-C5)-methyltransferase
VEAGGARRSAARLMAVVSVPIDSIAGGGDGVGRSNGLVVFVPRTAPGYVVTAQISGKGHFARCALRSIVSPSSVRIDPPCPHYTRDTRRLPAAAHDIRLAARGKADDHSRFHTAHRKRIVDVPRLSEVRRTGATARSSRSRWSGAARADRGLHPYDDPTHFPPLIAHHRPAGRRRMASMEADAYFRTRKSFAAASASRVAARLS